MVVKIKAIIFDMGGVTICPNELQILSKIAKLLHVKKSVLEKVALSREAEDPIVLGKITVNEFWKNICHKLNVSYDKKIADIWINDYKAPLKKDVIKLIKKLDKKYVVASITDVSKTRVEHHKKRGLYKPFKFVVFSCYVHVRKPHKKIYRIALQRLNLKPNQCIFIDDKLKNVKGARAAGMHAIRFMNAKQLKRDLRKYDVV